MTLDGGISVTAQGEGPGVFWVHGYSITSALWEPLFARLPGMRHHAVDLPGHGASAPLRPDDDLYTLGARLADYAKAERIAHLVGLSLGSTVALQMALSAPDAFETLAMGAPAIGGGPVEAAVGVRFRELRQLEAQLGRGPWLAERWTTSPPDLFTEARRNPDLWEKVWPVIAAHRWDELPGFAIARLALPVQPLPRIAALGCRLLVITGSRDMPAFVETARLLEQTLAGTLSAVLTGTGHMCMLEAPEAAATALRMYWSGEPAVRHLPAKFVSRIYADRQI